MARTWAVISAVLATAFAVYYQLLLKTMLSNYGFWREVEPVGNTNCKQIEALQACEKISLHPPSGLVYLACSTPAYRQAWVPALRRLDADKHAFDDYIATYDPTTDAVKRLTFEGFPTPQGYGSHGLDVVPSASNPNELFVYAINHRKPLSGNAKEVGANSVVEIFKTTVRGDTLTHVTTVEDPIIDTPNDLVGFPDGKSFYFTNDHSQKSGFIRTLESFGLPRSSVGYCHVDNGCKIAAARLLGSNGIARAQNGTVYLANIKLGQVRILEEQSDHSLVLTDTVTLDRPVDNVTLDENGALWAAGMVIALRWLAAMADLTKVAPSSAIRITRNTGEGAYFGENLKAERVFEDDGNLASGATTALHDARRNILYMHGLYSRALAVCKISA
ncbi:serum paraoxonase/arylesterase [Gloeopeniophorella convolvens]|nr:serum paraoxonase/arylesterase [Gloeopeniophorella convolvens]